MEISRIFLDRIFIYEMVTLITNESQVTATRCLVLDFTLAL